MVITPQVVPHQGLGKYMAIVPSVFVLSSILGPILGGAITRHESNWGMGFHFEGRQLPGNSNQR
jgi:MFS family permease